ncbi:hypothetical protein B9Z55_004135 [Caenorhabditis nigoni]|uniref:Uncharacterized protein n=1 Tax=Caenorhabditis nigoni TaxID=1611254 RepID=A0A2G5UUY9_9PELO|nr:hypothetical protein B9Z55_004135 [Caenorhabditis nigoni]
MKGDSWTPGQFPTTTGTVSRAEMGTIRIGTTYAAELNERNWLISGIQDSEDTIRIDKIHIKMAESAEQNEKSRTSLESRCQWRADIELPSCSPNSVNFIFL